MIRACLALLLLMALPAHAQTSIKVMLNWKLEGSNAPFFLAEDKGYYAAEGLKVQLDAGEGSSAPPSRIASGAYEMGFGDINSMVEFGVKNPQAAPLRAIYMVFNRPPMVVVATKKSGIAKPADLVGKTLGAPQFDTGYRLWPAFAKGAGIDPGAVKWVNMQPNLREALLVKGEVDAITGFDSTIGFNLTAKLEDVTMLYYADYGVDIYSNTLMTSAPWLDRNPEAAKGFVRAVNRAWRDSIADPDAAIRALLKRDQLLKHDNEKARLLWNFKHQILVPEVAEVGLGGIRMDRLERSIGILAAAFPLTSQPTVSEVFDLRFLPPLDERLPPK